MLSKTNIGIIGCGNMGEVIIAALSSGPVLSKNKLVVAEKEDKRRRYIKKKYQVEAVKDSSELIKRSNIIIIAVKPQDIDGVLAEIPVNLGMRVMVVSIAAGITTSYIEKKLKLSLSVVRVMPNIAARIGQSMSVLCKGRFTSKEDLLSAVKIFQTMGKTLVMQEKYLNIVTALSGSGPAYFYYFIESLIDSAMKLGITPAQAEILVKQTALGAVRMLQETKLSVKELKNMVVSKKGTTEAALKVFDKQGLNDIIRKAVSAANKRAKELSGK